VIQRKPVPASAQSALEEFKRSARYSNRIFEDFIDQHGDHPSNWRDAETSFAADALSDFSSSSSRIIDIGSNHLFVSGLCASRPITTIDVRARAIAPRNESIVVADAANIPLPDQSFDIVLSLNAIEHFGLGRYGDRVDLDADFRAAIEWKRLLAPGGIVIVSTTISSRGDALAFNAHRVYSHATIHQIFSGLTLIRESFYSNQYKKRIALFELETPEFSWDLYTGAFKSS